MLCAVGGVLRASRGEVFCARVPAGTAGGMAVPEDTGRLRTKGRATGRHTDPLQSILGSRKWTELRCGA